MKLGSIAVAAALSVLALGTPAIAAHAASATVPGSPTLKVVAGNGALTASWTAAPVNGAAVNGYRVISRTFVNRTHQWGAFTAVDLPASARARVLKFSNGTLVQVQVRARNVTGWGRWSSLVQQTVGLPGNVPNVKAGAGNARATITWSAASSNGSAISSYRLYSRSLTGGTWSAWVQSSVSGNVRSKTFTALTNGKQYAFYVRAVNSRGVGPVSAMVTAQWLSNPTAPAQAWAVASNRSATVHWTASVPQGSPVTGYKAYADKGGFHCEAAAAANACTVPGLTPGVSYSFTVFGQSALGQSSASPVTNSVTVGREPDAPTSPTMTTGGPSDDPIVTVAFIPPAKDGWATVDRYAVQNGISDAVTECVITSAATCVVHGLTPELPYYFALRAGNVYGNSTWISVTGGPVYPGAAPMNAPGNVVATPGDQAMTITWNAPNMVGYAPLIGYSVIDESTGLAACDPGLATTCTQTGLVNGSVHSYSVSATNLFGSKKSATTPDVSPGTVPGAPSLYSGTPGLQSVTLTMHAPADDGGGGITGYEADSGYFGTPKPCVIVTETTCVVSGLASGANYMFRLRAVNAFGHSDWSVERGPFVAAATPQAPPQNVVAAPGNHQITLTWDPPTESGYAPITHYKVVEAYGVETVCLTDGETTCTITGLTNGVPRSYHVFAVTDFGTSNGSTATPLVYPGTVPNARNVVFSQTANGIIQVYWFDGDDGGSPITGYTVTAEPGGLTCTTTHVTCVFEGLTVGGTYSFTVTATNAIGTSLPSLVPYVATASQPVP